MDKLLKDLPLFVEVARRKSFSQAADILDMPVSTVSRRISALERELGVPLFRRNSRNVELTDSGRSFYERCEFIVSEAALAREDILRNVQSTAGKVRIAMRPDSYHTHMADALLSFAQKWPDIQMQVHLSDRQVDLLTEPFDLEIRVGPLPDSNLKVRRLGTVYPKLYAAPSLLEKYPRPETPEDLAGLPCILVDGMDAVWNLYRKGETRKVAVKPAHAVNHLSVATDFALAGLGLAWLAKPMIELHHKKGELVALLPEWTIRDIDISIVMASSELPKRVRLLVEHLVDLSKRHADMVDFSN